MAPKYAVVSGINVSRFSINVPVATPNVLIPPFATVPAIFPRFCTVFTASSGTISSILLFLTAFVSLLSSVVPDLTAFLSGPSMFSKISIPRDSTDPPNSSTAPDRLSCMVFAISFADPSQFLYSSVSFRTSPDPRSISAIIPERDSCPNRVIRAWFFCSSVKPDILVSNISVISARDFILPLES